MELLHASVQIQPFALYRTRDSAEGAGAPIIGLGYAGTFASGQ